MITTNFLIWLSVVSIAMCIWGWWRLTTPTKKSDIVRYSHWDVLALAHLLDKNAWHDFYSIPEETRPYYTNHQVHHSVTKAASLLARGFVTPWRMLKDDADLQAWKSQVGWDDL